MTEAVTDPSRGGVGRSHETRIVEPRTHGHPARTTALARLTAHLLETRWLMRMPIPLYRAGLGWIFGGRLVMIEHLGRVSHRPRYAVVEVVERERNAIRVASGFGTSSQWYRNLRANRVAYLSTGRARRVPAAVRLLGSEESAAVLARYAVAHPEAYATLSGAMDYVAGGEAFIPVVEFTPPTGA
jgi:deazaflavin-dependent oxidoreductase (nitroreductase family)